MRSLITDAQVYIQVLGLFMGCSRKHTSGHASDYPCTPRVQNAVYTHTQNVHIHVHTDYMPMNIRVLEGEGKSYVSQDYVPGRYQETLAGGFHIAILSLIKTFFCHFFLSWLPNTVGQRY